MDQLARIPVTLCLSKVTLAAGTTTTISTTGTTTFAIRGKAYTKTAITNGATPTTDYATGAAFLPVAANQGSIYSVCLDSGGTVRVIQGTVVPLDATGAFINAPQFGPLTEDVAMIGYIVIKAGATAVGNWVFGTNNLSSVTGITYAFVDVIGEPDRPQVS